MFELYIAIISLLITALGLVYTLEDKKVLYLSALTFKWSSLPDSNRGRLAYKANALTH